MTELEAKAKDCIENHTHKLVGKPTKQDIYLREESIFISGYKLGAKENGIQWHKIFIDSKPNPCEYWELPQETLPKNEDFYFVKLKNGFIKICELKYDHWSKNKHFYDLHGGKQSNVAEWLEYPTV